MSVPPRNSARRGQVRGRRPGDGATGAESDARRLGWALFPVRLFLGVTFVYGGIQKLSDPGFLRAGAPTYIGTQLRGFANGTPGGFLLRAFAIHVRQRPSRLMLLGTGPMLDELRALAGSLGITDHVAFEGFVRNPLPYMRAADAFVLSSRSEGFGNVLVEALGCGTPVVSTDCPHGPSDILAHGKFGILVPPRDPEALAPAFGRILDERAAWPRERLQARAEAFSYRACADQYAHLFQSLVWSAIV